MESSVDKVAGTVAHFYCNMHYARHVEDKCEIVWEGEKSYSAGHTLYIVGGLWWTVQNYPCCVFLHCKTFQFD